MFGLSIIVGKLFVEVILLILRVISLCKYWRPWVCKFITESTQMDGLKIFLREDNIFFNIFPVLDVAAVIADRDVEGLISLCSDVHGFIIL